MRLLWKSTWSRAPGGRTVWGTHSRYSRSRIPFTGPVLPYILHGPLLTVSEDDTGSGVTMDSFNGRMGVSVCIICIKKSDLDHPSRLTQIHTFPIRNRTEISYVTNGCLDEDS